MTRVLAVDWSGAAKGAEKAIWLAEARDSGLVRLESGRSRRELVDHLIRQAEEEPELLVGLDFAFSFPEWFLEERGVDSARGLWRLVEREGESWLEACEAPFWGKPGKRKRELPADYRKTEREVVERFRAFPKSVFQIGGRGAVGTGTLRGIPHLLRLAEAGFSVWPFDAPSPPVVVEIYPRLFVGTVVVSDPSAREAFLERRFPGMPDELRSKAVQSPDAFDAAVSALTMVRHLPEPRRLPRPDDPRVLREGLIWFPERREGAESRFQEALAYAARLHAGQTRKGGEEIPYIGHLLGVCSLTLEAGGDEDQAIAALLHDAAEDQGGHETLESIRRRFGDRVAGIVEACTDTFEDPKPPWRPRKERYLEHIDSLPADTLLVVCADKLYNARAILQDCRRLGDRVFERFRPGKEGTLWYYRSVAEALARSDLESWLVEELARTVSELEAVASGRSGGSVPAERQA